MLQTFLLQTFLVLWYYSVTFFVLLVLQPLSNREVSRFLGLDSLQSAPFIFQLGRFPICTAILSQVCTSASSEVWIRPGAGERESLQLQDACIKINWDLASSTQAAVGLGDRVAPSNISPIR